MDGSTPPGRAGPQGTGILVGKDGPQLIRTTGKRWSEEAEALFLDNLAANCNVSIAAAAAGFTRFTTYKRRRRDPAFAKQWDAALEQGAARIRALLLQRAIEALEGFTPDPDTPIPTMTVKEALAVVAAHDRRLNGGPRSRREWARPRSLDEMRDSILTKLEAVAPSASFETGVLPPAVLRNRDARCASSSVPPQDERISENPAHPEEPLSLSKRRLEGPEGGG